MCLLLSTHVDHFRQVAIIHNISSELTKVGHEHFIAHAAAISRLYHLSSLLYLYIKMCKHEIILMYKNK